MKRIIVKDKNSLSLDDLRLNEKAYYGWEEGERNASKQ